MFVQNYSTTITYYFSYCGWWKDWCRAAVACIHSNYVTLERYFWEKKNLRTNSQEKWCNNRTYISNFISGTLFIISIWILEGTNYNYSPITSPGKCKTDYVMPELRIINSMPNIPSCATIVVLPTNEVTPITNYCSAF
jgi:hypothetical protein